jgi:hypothetical protein
MKFELLEPAGQENEEAATGTAAPTFSPPHAPAPIWPSQEELLDRMHDRTGALGTRLTRVIEAVRPSLHRMEAAIARAEHTTVAETGQATSATPPEGFRPDRFSARGGAR